MLLQWIGGKLKRAVAGLVYFGQATLDATGLTAPRTFTLPNKSGTLATTDDVAAGVADGDKGDITVTSAGAVWTIENGAVTPAKLSSGAPSWTPEGRVLVNGAVDNAVDGLQVGGSAYIAGGVRLPDGTTSAPALRFVNDVDTGWYRPDINTVGVVLGGTERMRFSHSRLLIGTTSSDTTNALLQVHNLSFPTSASNGGLYFGAVTGSMFSLYQSSTTMLDFTHGGADGRDNLLMRLILPTGTVLIGTSTDNGLDKLQVAGTVGCSGVRLPDGLLERMPMTKPHWYFEDFMYAFVNQRTDFHILVFSSATLGQATVVPPNTNHPGVMRITSSTSANSGAQIFVGEINSLQLPVSSQAKFFASLSFPVFTNVATRFGFLDTTGAGTTVDGVYAEVDTTGKIYLVSKATSVTTSTGSTDFYNLSVNTWYNFRLLMDGGAPKLEIYNDNGTLLDTIVHPGTNLPTAAGELTSPRLVTYDVSTTSRVILNVDLLACYIDPPAHRSAWLK